MSSENNAHNASIWASQRNERGRFVPGNSASWRPPLVRFFEKIEQNGACWEYQGAQVNGYGRFHGGQGVGVKWAYRWSYEYFVGPIPTGLTIDHLCRNKACVNPTHLEAVPQSVNVNRGSTRKVRPEQVAEILSLRNLKRVDVAQRYGVAPSTISRIWHGQVTYA